MLGEAVSKYRLEIIDLLRGTSFNYTVNSSKTNVELDFLKPFTSYEFKVFGSTSSWEGNITDTIMLKTQEDGRCNRILMTINFRNPCNILFKPFKFVTELRFERGYI